MGKRRTSLTALVTHVLLRVSRTRHTVFCLNVRRANTKDADQPRLLNLWHLQLQDHRHRQHEKEYVRGHVQHRSYHVQRCAIQTSLSTDEDVKVLHDWSASKNQGEHQSDIIPDYEEYTGVNAYSEPAYTREPQIEE
jgi:hypothetical protein